MKTVTYKCDHCKQRLEKGIDAGFISIGAKEDGRLFYLNTNKRSGRKVVRLGNHKELNFCGKDCFVNYFFQVENE